MFFKHQFFCLKNGLIAHTSYYHYVNQIEQAMEAISSFSGVECAEWASSAIIILPGHLQPLGLHPISVS